MLIQLIPPNPLIFFYFQASNYKILSKVRYFCVGVCISNLYQKLNVNTKLHFLGYDVKVQFVLILSIPGCFSIEHFIKNYSYRPNFRFRCIFLLFPRHQLRGHVKWGTLETLFINNNYYLPSLVSNYEFLQSFVYCANPKSAILKTPQ